MTDQPGPRSKQCPRCSKKDITDFSTCRFCGTHYDFVPQKQKNGFDLGQFLRSRWGMRICFFTIIPLAIFGRNLFMGAAVRTVLTDSTSTISDTTIALRQNPRDCEALVKRGDAYMVVFRAKQAVDDYSSAIAIRPHSADLYRKRAAAYEALAKLEEARKDRQTADSFSHQ